jgi:hypothetical protein
MVWCGFLSPPVCGKEGNSGFGKPAPRAFAIHDHGLEYLQRNAPFLTYRTDRRSKASASDGFGQPTCNLPPPPGFQRLREHLPLTIYPPKSWQEPFMVETFPQKLQQRFLPPFRGSLFLPGFSVRPIRRNGHFTFDTG